MSLFDEFEVFDSCTADTLAKGDIVFVEGTFVEITEIEDEIDIIIHGYSIDWEESVTYPIPAEHMFDLYKYKD